MSPPSPLPKRAAATELPQAIVRDFSPTDRYLVGVSGGRDSVALLHSLLASGYRRLVVCHLNHQLRGRAANADAAFVARLAAKHRLPFETETADVRKLAKQRKESIEVAARELRYSFFARVARRRRCATIFLGHHADDLVETFLINLFRGAGLTGLTSIRHVSHRESNGATLTLVRPLLSVWRNEIDAYIKQHALKFREDASNKQLGPLRNRVRHRVIPYLEKTFGRNVRQNIWRAAAIAAEEDLTLEALLPQQLGKMRELAIKQLRELSTALQRRALRDWLRASGVAEIGFELIERTRHLLDPVARIAKTNLPRNRHVRRRAGKLFIE